MQFCTVWTQVTFRHDLNFRLLPYFRGDHHLEEIMYYENLHRSDLMSLLDKFRSVLITCQYEDPATSFTHMDHHQNT